MELKDTIGYCGDIKLYEKGSAIMWTDEYISKQLLKAHLDPGTDAGSRNKNKIEKLCRWIQESFGEGRKKLLDLGCGPGLYISALSRLGFDAAGIDFSRGSIDYAKDAAEKQGLDIDYRCMNYLELGGKEEADIVMLIYCDFCVLSTAEQSALLDMVYRILRPGGVFVLDVYNESYADAKKEARAWECAGGGFWRKDEYISLSLTKNYPEDRVVLNQHIVIDSKGSEVYRFWSRWFEQSEMATLLAEHGFYSAQSCGNILRTKDDAVEETITFYVAYK